jgi:hypothetical protein
VVHCHDSAFAWLGGEIGSLWEARVLVLQTDETQTNVTLCIRLLDRGRADRHAEALRMLDSHGEAFGESTYFGEGSDLLVAVGVEVLLCVVDSHAAVDAVGQGRVLHDGDALVRAVGMFEVHHCGPVVAVIVRVLSIIFTQAVSYLKSSEKVHVVQVASSPTSPFILALNAFPPTIYLGLV